MSNFAMVSQQKQLYVLKQLHVTGERSKDSIANF